MATYTSSEATKWKMINAAGELAAELGIDNVSTRTVAERSGENIGSIHYHFGGKNGLWVAVVNEAMLGCVQVDHIEELDALEDNPTPEHFSEIVRKVIRDEITNIFRSGRPRWHSLVSYQLMQRTDELYQLFYEKRLGPGTVFMHRLIRMIRPNLTEEEVFIYSSLIKMPIYGHATYSKMMFKELAVQDYSDTYLQKLEDVLVRQAQFLLGLPADAGVSEL
ncbi:TetR/AcrR family transcriptional regulator [Tichowtungia aerotolerans]|uniref:TetR family transcriptional regulator n=1 Tax=Tichowtungia aerotolerans TaxID=2697043 RepID=A0A6P1MAS5_9BACT|nr:TetR family transcriptional regulator [Tichowtungia aerotolerans]QHI69198.1 TetR family transcriptional regulator [Tichowtungia aerotolerans]